MTMRIITIATRLDAAEAHTLIEFLDEMQGALMVTYGDDIRAMLQDANTTRAATINAGEDEGPF